MPNLLAQILQLISAPPGNLIYFLVLAFSVLAALQSVSLQKRPDNSHTANRLSAGLGIILGSQILLFLSSALIWQQIADPQIFLPPLERAVITLALIWLVWMWAFPQKTKGSDPLIILSSLGLVVFLVATLAAWVPAAQSINFNRTLLDDIWSWVWIGISLIGIGLLIIRRTPGWSTGLGFFIFAALGASLHLFLGDPAQDIPAAVRLALLCVFPLLPGLARPLSTSTISSNAEPAEIPTPPANQGFPKRQSYADPRTSLSWLSIAEAKEPDQYFQRVAQAVARTFGSDLCLVLYGLPQTGQVAVQAAYDLVQDESIQVSPIPSSQLPTIWSSLEKNKSILLDQVDEAQTPEVAALSKHLGFQEPGPLLAAPCLIAEHMKGALLIISPYSKHTWTEEDRLHLSQIAESIRFTVQPAKGNTPSSFTETLQASLEHTKLEAEQLRIEQRLLLEEMELLRKEKPAAATNLEMESLLALQKEAQESILRLEHENQSLRLVLQNTAALAAPSEEIENLEKDLRLTLEEVARLQSSLAEAKMEIADLQNRSADPFNSPAEEREVVASIVQELRQPISSILGYTDLLMSESVGILGALQRKFLERIKASSDRMKSLLDDLLQVTTFTTSSIELAPQPVDLDTILDQAITDISAQLREKNINLLMEIPEETPRVMADRDALHQIFIHLLQNASAVTPIEGNITLNIQVKNESDDDFLMVQVSDEGGGIPSEDLNKVFSRRYRADHPLIQGVGDTGVGLSIAKTLVEAHGGRIWVESEPGQTTTFSILLPVKPSDKSGPQK